MISRGLIIACIASFVLGCVGPAPYQEYTLSEAAMASAKAANASLYSPGVWSQAEEAYFEAKKHFKEREYDDAAVKFEEARRLAERAENISRLKKFQSGESF